LTHACRIAGLYILMSVSSVQGILGAVDTSDEGQERIFNLGNTHPHTVSEFVDLLEAALGKAAIRHYVDMPNLGDVLQTHSNITAANQAFGYRPQVRWGRSGIVSHYLHMSFDIDQCGVYAQCVDHHASCCLSFLPFTALTCS
jgi:hypothetical protein